MDTLIEPARFRAVTLLRSWIEDGTLGVGACLPSERELAQRIEVSKPSIHRALQILEHEGLISTAIGRTRTVLGHTDRSLLAQTLVVLAARRTAEHQLSTGFSDHVSQAACAAISDAGWHTLTFHPDKADAHAVTALLNQRPAGMCLPEPSDRRPQVRALVHRLHASGMPVVVNADGPEWSAYDRVVADHAQGGSDLMHFLLGRGRRRLVTIWTPGSVKGWWYGPRLAGMEAAVVHAGLPALKVLVAEAPAPTEDLWARATSAQDYLEHSARNWLGQIIDVLQGPQACDGILANCDAEAVSIAAAARLIGLRPGVDLDIVGYDHSLPNQPYAAVSAGLIQATVDRDTHAQGRALIEILLQRIAGDGEPQVQRRLVPSHLVDLSSGG